MLLRVSLNCCYIPTHWKRLLIILEYKVDSLPDIPFDVGELYSGLIPVNMNDTSRALFFVFQPTVGAPVDEISMQPGQSFTQLEKALARNNANTYSNLAPWRTRM